MRTLHEYLFPFGGMVWDITWVLTLGTSIRQSEGPAWTKVSESSVRSLQKYLHHQIVCISHNIYKKEEFTPPPTSVLIAPHAWTGRWKATTTLRKQASIAEHRARTIRSPLMRVLNARNVEWTCQWSILLHWPLFATARSVVNLNTTLTTTKATKAKRYTFFQIAADTAAIVIATTRTSIRAFLVTSVTALPTQIHRVEYSSAEFDLNHA